MIFVLIKYIRFTLNNLFYNSHYIVASSLFGWGHFVSAYFILKNKIAWNCSLLFIAHDASMIIILNIK